VSGLQQKKREVVLISSFLKKKKLFSVLLEFFKKAGKVSLCHSCFHLRRKNLIKSFGLMQGTLPKVEGVIRSVDLGAQAYLHP